MLICSYVGALLALIYCKFHRLKLILMGLYGFVDWLQRGQKGPEGLGGGSERAGWQLRCNGLWINAVVVVLESAIGLMFYQSQSNVLKRCNGCAPTQFTVHNNGCNALSLSLWTGERAACSRLTPINYCKRAYVQTVLLAADCSSRHGSLGPGSSLLLLTGSVECNVSAYSAASIVHFASIS